MLSRVLYFSHGTRKAEVLGSNLTTTQKYFHVFGKTKVFHFIDHHVLTSRLNFQEISPVIEKTVGPGYSTVINPTKKQQPVPLLSANQQITVTNMYEDHGAS